MLGEKLGIGGYTTGMSRYKVSPGRSAAALANPITSPGHASSSVERCWPNTDCAYLVTNGLPVAAWVSTSPRSNVPETTRAYAIRSRCELSMPACTLNTNALNGESTARRTPSTSTDPLGAGASSTSTSSNWFTPKFNAAEVNNTGEDSPDRNVSRS